jgi:hypothetical protein
LVAEDTTDRDLKAIFGGIDYGRIVSLYKLNWLEQTLLAMTFYEDKLERNNWEAFYVFVENCKDQPNLPVLELVKTVLSGRLLACIASLPEHLPNDALWFSCHVIDLLYYNTSSWLDPSLDLERPLNEHFAEKYAQALVANEDSCLFFLAMEYFCHSGEQGASHVRELLHGVPVSDPKFRKCLDIVNAVFPDDGIRSDMYGKLVNVQMMSDLQRALLTALESGIPRLVDDVCLKLFLERGDAADPGVEPELVDCSPYPLLQLLMDYNEFKGLFHSGRISEGISLLSKILIHRTIPSFFLEHIVNDVVNLNLLEGKKANCISVDAMYQLLEDLDRSVGIQDKRAGRLALLRGISQFI